MRWYRMPDMDDRASERPAEQDKELRRLVDLLPPVQRHLINRTVFGGAFLSVAARELGLEKRAARTLKEEALAQLAVWLEDPPDDDPALEVELTVDAIVWRCAYQSPWGDCQQPGLVGRDLCAFHDEVVADGLKPDAGYHRAVVEGRREPIQARLSKSEMDSLIGGRYRGDGRRLDQYTTMDPLEMGDWT